MMDQEDVFGPAKSADDDRETSAQTATELNEEGVAADQLVKVITAIDEMGSATAEDISLRLGLRINSVSPRLSHLLFHGVLVTDGKKRNSTTKRPAFLYRRRRDDEAPQVETDQRVRRVIQRYLALTEPERAQVRAAIMGADPC